MTNYIDEFNSKIQKDIEEMVKYSKIVTRKGIGFISNYIGRDEYAEKQTPKKHVRYEMKPTAEKIARIEEEQYYLNLLASWAPRFLNEWKPDLTYEQVFEIQTLMLNVLDAALEKGYQDGAKKIITEIAFGKLNRADCKIEHKNELVAEALTRLVNNYAKRTRREIKENEAPRFNKYYPVDKDINTWEDNDVDGKSYKSNAEQVMMEAYCGKFGAKLKGDVDFYKFLAQTYNHNLDSSRPDNELDAWTGSTHKIREYLEKERVKDEPSLDL